MRSEIADRRNFGIADDDRLVRKAHRQHRATFDASRAVTDDPVEFRPKLRDDFADAFFRQRILVPRLRSRQQPQILQTLVANEGLREICDALHHVDEIKNHASFGAQHEIKITQAHVEVDNDNPLSHLRQRCPEGSRRSCLADAAFT